MHTAAYIAAATGFALSNTVSAAGAGPASCCFGLTAYSAPGGPNGIVGELYDGQGRINQTNLPVPKGQYCIKDGGVSDSFGRGCILTLPTGQWQCDSGAAPTLGFDVSCNGTLTHDGDTTFWSCPTGDHDGWNIYSKKLVGEPRCTPIWLRSDGCANCPAPPPSTASLPPTPVVHTVTSTVCATTTTAVATKSACPMDLTGNWEFPHLIVPINAGSPKTAYGTSFNGTASGNISSIFNFDIPASDAGKMCNIHLLIPELNMLETSSYSLSGSPAAVKFALLDSAATKATTYSTAPKISEEYGLTTLVPGNAYTIGSMSCQAGKAIGISMTAVGNTSINFFQDFNPCPLGLYITVV